jgi:outer membrane protein OmpA-like peptidoglycan-associated protein
VKQALLLLCTLVWLAPIVNAQVFTPPQVRRPKAPTSETKPITAAADEAGCQDSPLLVRIPGCVILQCDKKSDDSVELLAGVASDGDAAKTQVDGESEVIYYLCPAKHSRGDIVKQLEGSLVKDSYLVSFSGLVDEEPSLSARKLDQWMQISTYMYEGQPAYIQTALKAAPEELISSAEFEDQFSTSLRVVLAALKFEAGKCDLPKDSEKILAEIAGVLSKKADWKIRVDVYAGDAADKQGNLELSQKRAAAVAEWFSAHGVEKERIGSTGHGDAVALSDANQRIELVKM